uniref:Tripartite motif containing 35-12 n=1 Tax=Pundamilia nyererei TaxID=303518 RepID=A0A3B4F5T9_9CICH
LASLREKMASGSEANLHCPVCCDIFKDPVLLSCSHSFCKVCLRRWWRRKEALECPVCKRISGKKHPPCNLALKNLCEAFLLESDQFKRLHKFLEEEEKARIAAVSAEERWKREVLKEKMDVMRREIAALSQIIRATEEELRAEDTCFLNNYKATAEQVQEQPLMGDPELLLGVLLDQAKHLGNLTFNILNKMAEASSYTPVILDPNTAHPRLNLSEDLSGVKRGRTVECPNNPERFDSFCITLGSQGFNSGLHSWEVELGHSSHWILGVAPESVKRKGHLGSHSGLWTMDFCKGKYKASSPSNSVSVLSVRNRIKRIRVCLDCDTGVLSFSDLDSLIYSNSCTSTEALFPVIGTSDKRLLKILPETILLNNTC